MAAQFGLQRIGAFEMTRSSCGKNALASVHMSTHAHYHLDSRDCCPSALAAREITQAVTMIVRAALSVLAGTLARIALMSMF